LESRGDTPRPGAFNVKGAECLIKGLESYQIFMLKQNIRSKLHYENEETTLEMLDTSDEPSTYMIDPEYQSEL